MRRISTICIFLLIGINYCLAQTTYYSRNAGTPPLDWNDSDSWTLNSDGSGAAAGPPTRSDNVVILNGHTIVIDAVDDNGSTGISPNGLNRPNVGNGCCEFGTAHFYQTGNITIQAGGTLDVQTILIMLEGNTLVEGTFTTADDIVNLGQMHVASGATLDCGDDLVLTGSSRTTIDETVTMGDDIYINYTEATLCGTGIGNVGNSSPNTAIIYYTNGATSAQICSDFDITCTANCGAGFPTTGSGGFSLDLTTFNYAKTITIDAGQVTGDLTNFPVLISISGDATLETVGNGGGVESANGYDIIFATADDCGVLSQLDHQLETFDGSEGGQVLVAWVKVPAVSSTVDTDIFMYYGNSSVTQDISVTTTFDYDYISIWHMQEDPATTNVLDATSTGNDATPVGTLTSSASGKIANSIDFDGASGNYIQTPSSELQLENNFTISTWFKADNTLQSMIIWQGKLTENGWGGSAGFSQEMQLSLGYCCPGGTAVIDDRTSWFLGDEEEENRPGLSEGVLSVDGGAFTDIIDWHYLVGTISSLDVSPLAELWLDGSSSGTNTGVVGTATARNLWDTNLRMGRPGADQRRFNGQIDEVRISKIVRSDDWIQTEYNNQSDPSTFFTVSSGATVNPCGPLPIELNYFKGKIQNRQVLLEWATASEINNDYFTIERSIDGLNFHELTTIPGAGNSNETLNYSYMDKNPFFGISYYRLKQTDYDGQFTYSNIIVIKLDHGLQELDFTLFPNPTKDMLNVQITGNTVLDVSIEMYNAQGQRLDNIISTRKIDGFELNVEHLSSGIYLIHLINENYRGIHKFVKE